VIFNGGIIAGLGLELRFLEWFCRSRYRESAAGKGKKTCRRAGLTLLC
jgi:hypothetical protein